jgi:hypothetical protein
MTTLVTHHLFQSPPFTPLLPPTPKLMETLKPNLAPIIIVMMMMRKRR